MIGSMPGISFSCPKVTQPKNEVPMSKSVLGSSCTDGQTHRQTVTDTHKSEYRGHPFRLSGLFPSTYHPGSVQ